jgi:hypothetical protein
MARLSRRRNCGCIIRSTDSSEQVGCHSLGLDPPSRHDRCRRCGGLFAPDGGGRGRHARGPEGGSPAVGRSEDWGAPRPHRQDHRRRPAGGIRQRRRRGALCGRDAARHARPRARLVRRAAHQVPRRHQSQRRDCRWRLHLCDGVNVAARPEALAEPGGICVSGTVRDQIRDRLP